MLWPTKGTGLLHVAHMHLAPVVQWINKIIWSCIFQVLHFQSPRVLLVETSNMSSAYIDLNSHKNPKTNKDIQRRTHTTDGNGTAGPRQTVKVHIFQIVQKQPLWGRGKGGRTAITKSVLRRRVQNCANREVITIFLHYRQQNVAFCLYHIRVLSQSSSRK